MRFQSLVSADVLRVAGVCALAGGLGGCFTAGGGGGSGGGTTPPGPAKFTAASGTINSQGVVTQVNYNLSTPSYAMTVENAPTTIQTQVQALNDNSGNQRVDTSVGSKGWFGTNNGRMETNGSAVRGVAVMDSDTWAVYSNTPGNRLDSSLGTSSLQHAYTGVGVIGPRSQGRNGDVVVNPFSFFGGKSTTDMPTAGKADYAGSFEGLEYKSFAAGPVQTSNISGKANLSADFAARTVRGRIDEVNNHSMGPVKQPSNYSIGFNGTITNSSFAGSSWLTQKNSDAPLNGFSQNSGQLQGGFFGPGAAETAGAIGVSAAENERKTLVTGAFGAKKK